MHQTEDVERQCLLNQMRYATTPEQVAVAENAADSWLRNYDAEDPALWVAYQQVLRRHEGTGKSGA